MPLLSIVVPCFNAANTVAVTVRSLLDQTLRDLEVVAVDDCSGDATREVLAELADQDRRLCVVRNSENMGLASARNVGLAASSGAFIAYVDADDWVSPTFHERLVSRVVEAELDFVRCDHVRVTQQMRSIVRAPEREREVTRAPNDSILPLWDTSMVDYPYAWTGVFSRAFLERQRLLFPEGLRTAEDRPWVWRLFVEGRSYQTLSEMGYFYRQEGGERLTQVGDARQLEFFRAMDMVLDYLDERAAPDLWKAKAYRTYLSILASQHARRERLEPEVAAELERRARSLGQRLESRILYLAVEGLDMYRAEMLSKLTAREITSYP